MDILIRKDNEQHGPYSEEEIRQHLNAGTFSQDDLAWTEGQADWTPLSSVLSGTPVPPPPPQEKGFTTEKPSSEKPSTSSMKTFSESIVGKLGLTARLTRKQAHRKKLEMVDLRQADYQTGKKAFEENLSPDLHPGTRSQISALRQQMDALGIATEGPAVSLTDKARAVANTAARKARVEALNLKQKGLLTHLGTKLRGNPSDDPALTAEISGARKTAESIQNLDSEIELLSSQTFTWARRPLLIVVIGIGIAAAFFGNSWFRGIHQSSRTERLAAELAELRLKELKDIGKERQIREVEHTQLKLDLQKREIEQQQQLKARRARSEADQRQHEADIARQNAERKRLIAAEVALNNALYAEKEKKLEDQQLQADKLREKEILEAKLREEQKLADAAREKQEKQVKALAYADQKLSTLSLEPEIRISKGLTAFGTLTECVGEELRHYKDLQAKKDWQTWFKGCLKDGIFSSDRYPDREFLTELKQVDAMAKHARTRRYHLLVKTKIAVPRIWVLKIGPRGSYGFPAELYDIPEHVGFKEHPDGIGYTFPYEPDGGALVLILNPAPGQFFAVKNRAIAEYENVKDAFIKQTEKLRQKKSLGELNEEAVTEQIHKLEDGVRAALFGFADRY